MRNKQISWLIVLISLTISLSGPFAYAQPEDRGVIVLKDESREDSASSSALENLIFEPVQIVALMGYSVDGTFWTEFGATAGLWFDDIHVSGEAELRGLTFNLGLEVETQLNNLGVSAGVRLTSLGVELSGGIRTTWDDFTVAARAVLGSNNRSANTSVTTQVGDLEVHLGASLSGNLFNASAGATLPLPGNLVTLSASAGFDSTGFSATAGADMLFSSSLAFSANAGIGGSGLTTSLGGQFSIDSFDLSAHGTWGNAGIGITAESQLRLASLKLFGRLRLDEDSYSADVGASTQWGVFVPTLTIGLDQQGLKWIQIEVTSEVDPVDWIPK